MQGNCLFKSIYYILNICIFYDSSNIKCVIVIKCENYVCKLNETKIKKKNKKMATHPHRAA